MIDSTRRDPLGVARIAVGALLALGLTLGACSSEDAASRAREAADKIQAQIGDPQAEALAQKVSPALVREAQEHLRTVREYLGDANGKLDSVTVNAVEAFQTTHGLEANGMLNDQTMEKLRGAAKKKRG